MKLTAIILAGGKSSRMGEDKGLMNLNDKPMIQYVIDAAKPLVDDIMIISNQKAYKNFGYLVYEDIIKNQGPLAGIMTGLHYSKTQKNLVLSCDVPFVSEEMIKELINHCQDADVVISKKNNQTHQLIGIYDKSCFPLFKNELENDQRKIKLALKKLNCKIINLDHFDDQIFTNINSKDDIKA